MLHRSPPIANLCAHSSHGHDTLVIIAIHSPFTICVNTYISLCSLNIGPMRVITTWIGYPIMGSQMDHLWIMCILVSFASVDLQTTSDGIEGQ